MQDLELEDNFSNEIDVQAYRELQEKESYELMRICRLNRIKIKNPEKWDKARYEDFVENEFIQTDNIKKGPKQPKVYNDDQQDGSANQTMLTINEEVTIYEYAPKKFQEIREMDSIDKDKIKYSLSAKRNRDQVFQAGES